VLANQGVRARTRGKRWPPLATSVMFMQASVASFATLGPLLRRLLLGFILIASTPLCPPALADTVPADATAVIKHFNDTLLAAMKTGEQTDFGHRFQALAPEVDQAFDLPAVLAVSIGPGWASLSPDQQNRLLDAFRRYTVVSYLANFNSYAGQSFTVLPAIRSLGAGRVLVQSRVVTVRGEETALDYVMNQTPAGWKVVDVLVAGSISRVAVQRSDFRHILSNGGGDALVVSLQRKTADLSGRTGA
jgi:phospholipid transport system substrate-binding protein